MFGNPEIQNLIIKNFIPVAADDWYQRRRQDAEGEFFRSVADQGPRKGAGGSTRQGRYAFSASGKLLGFNNNRSPERMLTMLSSSLEAFAKLPKSEPVTLAASTDNKYTRTPPADGLVLKAHTRCLEDDLSHAGKAGANTDTFRHNGFGAATDHLWITADEKHALASVTKNTPLPANLAKRIARFHLVDSTRGEPPHWRQEEIRSIELTATKSSAGSLSLSGSFHLATADDTRGYSGQLRGTVQLAADHTVTRFDLVALGDHWGEGTYTRGARPGKTPLAVAFSLADLEKPADRVPPQGIRWEQGYYQP